VNFHNRPHIEVGDRIRLLGGWSEGAVMTVTRTYETWITCDGTFSIFRQSDLPYELVR
jgi:hypothetical protein